MKLFTHLCVIPAKYRLSIRLGDIVGKFIIVSFFALGFAFYEFSGGSDFVPESRVSVADAADVQPVEFTTDVAVSRSNAASLIALNPTVTPVSLDTTPATTIPVAAPAVLDIRAVAGSRVNMRQGPGTSFDVVTTLDRGARTEVLEVNREGWARVEVVSTGQIGWMAERLLTDG